MSLSDITSHMQIELLNKIGKQFELMSIKYTSSVADIEYVGYVKFITTP